MEASPLPSISKAERRTRRNDAPQLALNDACFVAPGSYGSADGMQHAAILLNGTGAPQYVAERRIPPTSYVGLRFVT